MKQYIKETRSYHHAFPFSFCVMTCLSLTLPKKPGMDEKKIYTWEFQLKHSSRNMTCKLLQKRFTGKTIECSKHLRHIAIEKNILSELNRCILPLKYIKLDIQKILYILLLCSFNFYFKIMWPSPQTKLLPQQYHSPEQS